jgi:hypothetical protein
VTRAKPYTRAPLNGIYSQQQAAAMSDLGPADNQLKWLGPNGSRCDNPVCPRWTSDVAAGLDPRILVGINSRFCSKPCAKQAGDAVRARNKVVLPSPPEPDEDSGNYEARPLPLASHTYAADGAAVTDLLTLVSDSGGKKGFVAYKPVAFREIQLADRVEEIYNELARADAVPVGPRAIMYILVSRWPGSYKDGTGYSKDDEGMITDVIKFMRQGRRLKWSWVSDASAMLSEAWGYEDASEYERAVAGGFVKHLQTGQPLVLEIYTEASASVQLISKIAHSYGVNVYSGSGSTGPATAREVATRALRRAYDFGQSTHVGGLGDCDHAGFIAVMRPHAQGIAAFANATNDYNKFAVSLPRDLDDPLRNDRDKSTHRFTFADMERERGATLTFEHIGLTPEYISSHDAAEADPNKYLLQGTRSQRARLEAYADSGTDMFDRNHDFLLKPNDNGDYKKSDDPSRVEVQLEALHPATGLRPYLVGWFESRLDMDKLRAAWADEGVQSDIVKSDMARAARVRKLTAHGWPRRSKPGKRASVVGPLSRRTPRWCSQAATPPARPLVDQALA